MAFPHYAFSAGAADALFTVPVASTIVVVCSLLGIVWAVLNYVSIKSVDLTYPATRKLEITQDEHLRILDLGDKIAMVPFGLTQGAMEFLTQEYLVCLIFVGLMFVIIFVAIEQMRTAYTAFAFLLGAITSMVCGAIGMMIATFTNYRVTYSAKISLAKAFEVAYKGGCVMGFALVSIGLLSTTSTKYSATFADFAIRQAHGTRLLGRFCYGLLFTPLRSYRRLRSRRLHRCSFRKGRRRYLYQGC